MQSNQSQGKKASPPQAGATKLGSLSANRNHTPAPTQPTLIAMARLLARQTAAELLASVGGTLPLEDQHHD